MYVLYHITNLNEKQRDSVVVIKSIYTITSMDFYLNKCVYARILEFAITCVLHFCDIFV